MKTLITIVVESDAGWTHDQVGDEVKIAIEANGDGWKTQLISVEPDPSGGN
jgi:hypothetical protein